MVAPNQQSPDEVQLAKAAIHTFWLKFAAGFLIFAALYTPLVYFTQGLTYAWLLIPTFVAAPAAYLLSPKPHRPTVLAWILGAVFLLSAVIAMEAAEGYMTAGSLFTMLALVAMVPFVTPFQARVYLYVSNAVVIIVGQLTPEISLWDHGPVIFSRVFGAITSTVAGLIIIQGYQLLSRHIIRSYSMLHSKQQAQSRMFAIIGHELRTPVSSINLMAKMNGGGTYQEELVAASKQLLHVLDDLKSVGNPNTPIQVHKAPFLISNLVKTLKSELLSITDSHNFALNISSSVADTLWLRSDANRIQTILSNFVRNACKHSGGSTIDLNIDFDSSNEELKFSICDDGTGIEDSLLDNLFAPFVKGGESSDGSGLGLFIAKNWAEHLGGEIGYQPDPGGGACFQLTLPAQIAERPTELLTAGDKISRARELLTGGRILLVEDDRLLQKLHSKLLTNHFHCDVVIAEDGNAALEQLTLGKFDVVVTDYFMPKMNGKELIKILRMNEYHQMIIAITAATVGDEMRDLLAAGADAVISKPLDSKKFADTFLSIAKDTAPIDQGAVTG